MKDYGRVRGSKEQAKPLIIGKDTVYVHSNIIDVEDDQYEYSEIQYGKDEFIKLIAEDNGKLQSEIVGTKLAMAELIEIVTEGGV